jgi:hypothetical protein
MPLLFLLGGKSSKFEFIFGLLALLNQVSATVNDLGFHEPALVFFARTLDKFD